MPTPRKSTNVPIRSSAYDTQEQVAERAAWQATEQAVERFVQLMARQGKLVTLLGVVDDEVVLRFGTEPLRPEERLFQAVCGCNQNSRTGGSRGPVVHSVGSIKPAATGKHS